MSSCFDNVECPECGKIALMEQDHKTLKTHTHCICCGYDSDFDEQEEYVLDDDVEYSEWTDDDFDDGYDEELYSIFKNFY